MLTILVYASVSASVAAFVVAIFMGVRNNWVYLRQMELNRFENGRHIIKEYASYNEMMFKFWIWDVEKFRNK